MLLCNETVTLVRHIAEKQGDFFTCTAISGVSWHGRTVIRPPSQMGSNGVELANVIQVCIPEAHMPDGLRVQTGDYLVRGALESVSSLRDLQNYAFMKVLAVTDNRRGRLRHWAVSGA